MPKTARATSADVARRANVSRATVSYVLNDKPGQSIPDATREAVRRAAEELGYRPNVAARQLAGGTGGVLILVPAVRTSDQLTHISKHLTQLLAARHLFLSLTFDVEDAPALVDIARATGAGSVLAMRSFTPAEIDGLAQIGVTAVGGSPTATDLNRVVGRVQVDHLYDRGHRRIAFARPGEPGLEFFLDARQAGASQRADELGLPQPLYADFALDGSDADERVREWYAKGVTGVVAYNDDVALRVLHGIRRCGLRCPDDLAVIGVDDTPAAAVSDPPLSTVELRTDRFAAILISELIAARPELAQASDAPVRGPLEGPETVRLVVRDSTGGSPV